uniref:Uncharacterized protein n=1 Tax=Hyaloperonospora arabidopsidis (strain Emoy2) TaxID=559515 RepID=M4B3T9_HYAAE
MLVSLTVPKPCAKYFEGPGKTHYVGGRFVPKSLAKEFNLELPIYPGVEPFFMRSFAFTGGKMECWTAARVSPIVVRLSALLSCIRKRSS